MRTPGKQPRILLTNVKQLELLLTRQQDIELFAGARLDYLVFDEAHTFTGAMGAETACLIRRLRSFCNVDPTHTRCIATSATIVDPKEPDAARNFAARFFGVPADDVVTVSEDYEAETWAEPRVVPPTPKGNPSEILDECVRAVEDDDGSGTAVQRVYRSLAGRALETPNETGWPTALHAALSGNELAFRLNAELAGPRALEELPDALEKHVGRPVTEAEVLSWLTLGAAARQDERPLMRPVIHGFVRGIGGAVVSFPEEEVTAPASSDRKGRFPLGWIRRARCALSSYDLHGLWPALLHRFPQGLHLHRGRRPEAERPAGTASTGNLLTRRMAAIGSCWSIA